MCGQILYGFTLWKWLCDERTFPRGIRGLGVFSCLCPYVVRTDEGGRNVKRAGANERRRHATGEQKKKGWRNSGKLCVAVSTNAYALENTLGGGQQWTQGERRRACSGRPVKTCGAQHEAPSHFGMDSATSLRVRMGQARGLFRRISAPIGRPGKKKVTLEGTYVKAAVPLPLRYPAGLVLSRGGISREKCSLARLLYPRGQT